VTKISLDGMPGHASSLLSGIISKMNALTFLLEMRDGESASGRSTISRVRMNQSKEGGLFSHVNL
jgi:hypothetical protein